MGGCLPTYPIVDRFGLLFTIFYHYLARWYFPSALRVFIKNDWIFAIRTQTCNLSELKKCRLLMWLKGIGVVDYNVVTVTKVTPN